MKKTIALLLALAMCFALCACGQSDAAKAADEQIKAIGTVTLDSKEAIEAAEAAVAELSDEDKDQLKKLFKGSGYTPKNP